MSASGGVAPEIRMSATFTSNGLLSPVCRAPSSAVSTALVTAFENDSAPAHRPLLNVAMLKGAMRELVVGDPGQLSTDVGPVIDEAAQKKLEQHAAAIQKTGKLIEQLPLPESCKYGTYFAPCAVEIES